MWELHFLFLFFPFAALAHGFSISFGYALKFTANQNHLIPKNAYNFPPPFIKWNEALLFSS